MAAKAQQLVFAALADPEALAPAEREFVIGVRVDRSGIARYLHLIRDPNDPERSPRPVGGRADRAPHRTIAELSTEACGNEILALLADGVPRTFNAIGVELLDHTADTLAGSPYDVALWRLVDERQLEQTLDAPVLFRLSVARAF
jgi:hypothetical protein